jgi:ABC-2 type transport system permease protein
MREALVTEFAKLRRSWVPLVTAAVMAAAVCGAGLLIWIVQHPELAASLGLLGTKANLAGLQANWPAFGDYVVAICGASGLLLLAFIVAFVFAREYLEDTAKNMLASPVPRWAFVVAKLMVAATWWLALVVWLLLLGFIEGSVMGLPDFSVPTAIVIVAGTAQAAIVCYLLVPMVAWVTVASRNALAGVGFALGMLLLGNLLGHTGWAVWFPWSIAALLFGLTGDPEPISAISLAIVVVTCAVGVAATIRHFARADVT